MAKQLHNIKPDEYGEYSEEDMEKLLAAGYDLCYICDKMIKFGELRRLCDSCNTWVCVNCLRELIKGE